MCKIIENKNLIINVFLVIISSTIIFAGIEIYLRSNYVISDLLSGYYPLGNDIGGASIHFEQYEYNIEMKYNNQGFREREFRKEIDVHRRILMLGDSFLEGQGVNVENRFSDLLQKDLNRFDSKKYEVINAGQIATNPISYFLNLMKFGIAMKPLMVMVFVFIGNDFMEGRNYGVPLYEINELLPNNARPWYMPYIGLLVKQWRTKEKILTKKIKINDFWSFYYKTKIDENFFLRMSNLDKKNYDKVVSTMPSKIVKNYLDGLLNPSFFLAALKTNDSYKGKYYNIKDVMNVSELLYEMKKVCMERDIVFHIGLIPSLYQVHSYKNEYISFLNNELHIGTGEINRLKELTQLQKEFEIDLRTKKISYTDFSKVLNENDYYLYDSHLNDNGHKKIKKELKNVVSVFILK